VVSKIVFAYFINKFMPINLFWDLNITYLTTFKADGSHSDKNLYSLSSLKCGGVCKQTNMYLNQQFIPTAMTIIL
jgi:hypothetical protein